MMSASVNDVLVDSFWSHVRLGQWQLARGTINLIQNNSKDQCKDLLTALVLQPKNHRYFFALPSCYFKNKFVKYNKSFRFVIYKFG